MVDMGTFITSPRAAKKIHDGCSLKRLRTFKTLQVCLPACKLARL